MSEALTFRKNRLPLKQDNFAILKMIGVTLVMQFKSGVSIFFKKQQRSTHVKSI